MQVLPPSSTGGPSRLFIMRPVATTLLMVAILLAGIIGYRALPVSALPEVDYPTIQVVTLYPGASPDVMTSAVTAPLERQFGQMSGLKQMSSQSSGGASVITLQFQLTLPLDVAEQEVQAAINAATNLLPSDLPNPPVYSKVNPADPPIMTLAVTSTAMPMTQGVVMSMGFALTERYPLTDCRPTAKYGTLGLFRANQIPEITPIIVEKAGLNVACGAIGIGEITSIPTAPAIADAYYRYDGKFRTSLPLEGTPYSRK